MSPDRISSSGLLRMEKTQRLGKSFLLLPLPLVFLSTLALPGVLTVLTNHAAFTNHAALNHAALNHATLSETASVSALNLQLMRGAKKKKKANNQRQKVGKDNTKDNTNNNSSVAEPESQAEKKPENHQEQVLSMEESKEAQAAVKQFADIVAKWEGEITGPKEETNTLKLLPLGKKNKKQKGAKDGNTNTNTNNTVKIKEKFWETNISEIVNKDVSSLTLQSVVEFVRNDADFLAKLQENVRIIGEDLLANFGELRSEAGHKIQVRKFLNI
jgi:hypothetical protein